MLGNAVGGTVLRSDIAWEPSSGVLAELLHGRRILFLANHGGEGARDLYRARVRLTLDARPVSIASVRNLTTTPFGDEHMLVVFREYAALAIRSYGRIGQVTILDLDGTASAGEESSLDAFMRAITNFQETGSFRGLGRTDVLLDAPEPRIALGFEPDGRLAIGSESGRKIDLDTRSGTVSGDTALLPVHVLPVPTLPKRPILWAVDTIRAEVGPEPIAWLEEKVFGVRDWVRRSAYGASHSREAFDAAATTRAPEAPIASGPLANPSGNSATSGGDSGTADESRTISVWPPAPIPSPWGKTEAGEGTWQPVTYPWLRRPPFASTESDRQGTAPAYFYRTTIRPDSDRPYAKVLIVAMDIRQLEFGMEGGVEDPVSLTGLHGEGRIPRDPKVLSRVVGAFNGAFKTTHGEYGMMVDHRVLLPPKPQAASFVVTSDHRVGLGTWGASVAIPNDVVSFRQNLDPLIEDGKLLPTGRTQWGFQLPGTSMFTVRSGVCLAQTGHVYYFWGEELSGTTLARAMRQAGCAYGMHLDMNPRHTAFVFVNVRSPRDYDAKLLTPEMDVSSDRYIGWSPKDFFYVMLRDTRPSGELPWAADLGMQPTPSWSTAVWHATWSSPKVATPVDLTAFDPGRVRWRLGKHEAVDGDLVLAAVQLGDTPKEPTARDTKASWRGFRGEAALALDHAGQVSLSDAGGVLAAAVSERIELPWIMRETQLLPTSSARQSSKSRGALCVAPSGHIVLASSVTDSDQLNAEALRAIGCANAVALDRGGGQPWTLDRAGTPSPPQARYPHPMLYAVSRPMPPGSFRFGKDERP